MIPTDVTETADTWVCGTCSSVNAGWRLRCERCGVLVRSSTSWGPPLPSSEAPPAAPKKRSKATTVLSVIGCLALGAVGLGAVGVGYDAFQRAEERRQTDQRVDDQANAEAEDVNGAAEKGFYAADSQFRATFPVPPMRSTDQIDVDGITREMTIYMTNVNLEMFFVATVDLQPGSPFDMSTAGAMDEDTKLERATTTTWQGFEAVEALMTDADGLHLQMLIVRTPQRVYLLTVGSMDDPTAEYETFKASFEITL